MKVKKAILDLNVGCRLFGVAIVLSGCASLLPTPSAPPTASVSATLPRIQAASQTNETQRHGRVSITVAASRFDTASVAGCAYAVAPRGLIEVVPRGVTQETHAKLRETSYSDLVVSPSDLSFLVTIRNGMSRVFRGAGALVQFSVDNHVQAVQQSNYVEFISALIPPGGETQLRISGPSMGALADSATLGVSLFDVVTDIDNAGNVTKRDNFEWFFRVKLQRIQRSVPATARIIWLPRGMLRNASQLSDGGDQIVFPKHQCVSTDQTP
ncbi:MAG: hypothetical protein ABR555_19225 [Pyrinomonadaceae bacterium]